MGSQKPNQALRPVLCWGTGLPCLGEELRLGESPRGLPNCPSHPRCSPIRPPSSLPSLTHFLSLLPLVDNWVKTSPTPSSGHSERGGVQVLERGGALLGRGLPRMWPVCLGDGHLPQAQAQGSWSEWL